MTIMPSNQFFVCLFFILPLVIAQKFVGDACQRNEVSGNCQYIDQCPSALQQLITQRVPPQICGYDGGRSIVCCTSSLGTQTTPPPTTTSTTTRRAVTTPETRQPTESSEFQIPVTKGPPADARISVKKCYEYANYVYTKHIPPVAIIGQLPEIRNDCGLNEVELIVGGKPANPKEFPHMAVIGYSKDSVITWECGGSLVSENYVLTAGHCLYSRQSGWASHIRLGDLDIESTSDDARPQEIEIGERIPHPQYEPPAQYNDMALLKLKIPAKLNAYVHPGCLHTVKEFPYRRAIATGWGNVEFGGARSSLLLQVTLDLFTNEQCRRTYPKNSKLNESIVDKTQLCAGSYDKEKDTCQGDSGGPLQIINKDVYCMYNIIGVTSFGKACGKVNIPGVYSRVSDYLDWIEKTVWP